MAEVLPAAGDAGLRVDAVGEHRGVASGAGPEDAGPLVDGVHRGVGDSAVEVAVVASGEATVGRNVYMRRCYVVRVSLLLFTFASVCREHTGLASGEM